MWTSRRKAVLAACRAARRSGTPTRCILARCLTRFSSSPTSRLVIAWSGLSARIVLRVAFRTCIAFAGRTDSGSGVRDALLSFRSRCLVFPDLVYFLFLVSKSLFSIFIRSWICFTFRAFEQCCRDEMRCNRNHEEIWNDRMKRNDN